MRRCAQSSRSNVLAKYASLVDFSRASPLSLFEQPDNPICDNPLATFQTIEGKILIPALPVLL
jgi:hypothetical protein